MGGYGLPTPFPYSTALNPLKHARVKIATLFAHSFLCVDNVHSR